MKLVIVLIIKVLQKHHLLCVRHGQLIDDMVSDLLHSWQNYSLTVLVSHDSLVDALGELSKNVIAI